MRRVYSTDSGKFVIRLSTERQEVRLTSEATDSLTGQSTTCMSVEEAVDLRDMLTRFVDEELAR